ncbi:MAG: extracellular solute-binding protein [Ruminococcaceae bacterium]|nr:extracellular solute-binding protein [Oscillospiraceae bacterium]
MSKKFKKGVAIALVGMMVLLCGCGNKVVTGGAEYDFEVTMAPGYPVDSADVLEWWVPINKSVTAKYGNLSETPYAKMVEEATSIKVNYIHPPQGQEATQFNIILSSGDMPDIISYAWHTYANGGWAGALNDQLIIPINKILEKGGAPAYAALLESDPETSLKVRTDDGLIPGFAGIGAKNQVSYYGAMIRQDLLDKVGMEIPETNEELDKVLYAFKDLGIEIPLEVLLGKGMVATNAIVGGFGVGASYFVDDNGKVKYGPAEPEFKEFLALMNKWFKDGIYDKEFASLDGSNRMTNEVLAGHVGVAFGANGGSWGKWLPALEQTRPDIKFVPMPFPTEVKGTKPEFGHFESGNPAMTAITTSCKNIELAAKLLDYGYTEKGHLQNNYGVQDRDWVYDENGVIRFTDTMTKPELNGNQSISDIMGQHTATYSNYAPRVQDEGIINVLFSRDDQKENLTIWNQTNMASHAFPAVQYTAEETQDLASIKTAVETYMHEMLYKFIGGAESLDSWDTYVANYKTIGLDRALEIMQAAYDRYIARTK